MLGDESGNFPKLANRDRMLFFLFSAVFLFSTQSVEGRVVHVAVAGLELILVWAEVRSDFPKLAKRDIIPSVFLAVLSCSAQCVEDWVVMGAFLERSEFTLAWGEV